MTDRPGDRERIILDATLELAASEGLLKTSISKISKRSQSSPGIVYHYFESKDEIMQTLFENVYREMTAYVMDDAVLTLPVLERYRGLWLRKYHFHRDNPEKTVFLEQFKNSSYFTQEQEQFMVSMMWSMMSMGQDDINRGLVVNLPLDVIYTMTMTVALNLANSHNQAGVILNDETLDVIAERVCRSVLT